eukprot:12400726-Karenia_brevis.AAC.1
MIDAHGHSATSMEHRCGKAEGLFWVSSAAFLGQASLNKKISAWQRGPSNSATFGASTWHVTKGLLTEIKRWEFKWLRKVLKLPPKPDDSRFSYLARTARRIESWYKTFKGVFAHQRVLKLVYRSAYREDSTVVGDGCLPVRALRRCRDRIWWDFAVTAATYRQRKAQGWSQARHGHHTAWEDVFVEYLGINWRQKRDSMDYGSWKSGESDFVNYFCFAWDLPAPEMQDSDEQQEHRDIERP